MIPVIPLEPKQLTTYPFTWLDQLTEVTLNPDLTESSSLGIEDCRLIRQELNEECRLIWRLLKLQRFAMLFKKRHSELVLFYYESLSKTHELVARYIAIYPPDDLKLELSNDVLKGLNDLLQQLRNWYGPLLSGNVDSKKKTDSASPSFKVLCKLSVDQIAIVLKAADEIRLLTSRSFSLVLRTLIPFLSTERLQDFSWKSARSSTYKMEGTDKEIAIRTLEALIEKIREY